MENETAVPTPDLCPVYAGRCVGFSRCGYCRHSGVCGHPKVVAQVHAEERRRRRRGELTASVGEIVGGKIRGEE